MVNDTQNIRNQVLAHLFQSKDRFLSGEAMSQALGISRVAVWKHMTALREKGLDIASGPKGYCLARPDDLLFPFCFSPPLQTKVSHFFAVDSTMNEARKSARKGADHLSLVVAETQTSGRGRLNRQWVSSPGGLWFSLILKPKTPPALAYIYNFIAATSLCQTIHQLYGLTVNAKWPNDLLAGGKKLAGMLSEMETRGDMVHFLNIGIGLNVNNPPAQEVSNTTSLSGLLKRHVPRKELLEAFWNDFAARSQTIDPDLVIRDWKTRAGTIGRTVRVETQDRTYTGRAIDVDNSGALIIEAEDGTGDGKQTENTIYGDCFHT